MKKLIIKSIIAVLCIAGIVLGINSCEGDSLVNFHKISIPEYSESDYLKLLDNKNEDIVYNSISNLIEHGNEYGKILSSDTTSKDTVKYKLAKEVYSKVSSHLKSDDEWVLCASIRFISAFGTEYKNPDEVIEKLLGIKKMTKSIQLEIMDGFLNTTASESKQYHEKVMKKVIGFQNNKSWLLSRYAYPLTGKNTEMTSYLINDYKNRTEDFEKLLIIQAVSEDFNDTVFNFLSSELINSTDDKIRLLIIKSLGKASNPETVIGWIRSNFKVLEKDVNEIFGQYKLNIESTFGSQLMISLLENGFDPNSVLTNEKDPELYKILQQKLNSFKGKTELKTEETEELNNLKAVETAIVNNKSLNTGWENYIEKQKKPEFPAEMLAKHRREMADLALQTNKLFDKYQIDSKYKEAYLKRLEDIDREFFENK